MSEDDAPSSFLIQIARTAGADVVDVDGAPLVAPDVDDLTLRGLVARLRRAALDGNLPAAGPVERERARRATRILAVLADAGAPGADPAAWAGQQGPTSSAPLDRLHYFYLCNRTAASSDSSFKGTGAYRPKVNVVRCGVVRCCGKLDSLDRKSVV